MRLNRVVKLLTGYFEKFSPRPLDAPNLVPSAVLALFYEQDDTTYLTFISRTRDSKVHSGEMAFPGGRFEAAVDITLKDTALREAQEEIGVEPSNIHLFGQLDDIWTITGYRIRPFVGYTNTIPKFERQEEEVWEVHAIPLVHLLDEKNFQESVARWTSTKYPLFFFFWGRNPIFGATAYILFDMLYNVFEFRPTLKRSVEELYAIRHDPTIIQAAIDLYREKTHNFKKRGMGREKTGEKRVP